MCRIRSCSLFDELTRWRYSQGGVKLPTGGMKVDPLSPRAAFLLESVSRSGETPEPTVTVRMKENACDAGVLSKWGVCDMRNRLG